MLGVEAPNYIMHLLGPLWGKWFTGENPSVTDYVPRQTCRVVTDSLQNIANAWHKETQDERNVERNVCYLAAILGAAKKRKILLERDVGAPPSQ